MIQWGIMKNKINVIDKKLIIAAVKKISSIVGKEYTVVRYDPIFLSPKYDLNYHLKCFPQLYEYDFYKSQIFH